MLKNTLFALVLAVTTSAFAAGDKAMTTGEVKRIDAAQGKLTIKHGDITNLDMPGMTMVFDLLDKDQVSTVKKGDKVLFHVEMDGQRMVITDIVVQP
jgi:Cu(I)/Ag(I) efflux system periplasmic protein CusF